MKLAVVPDQHEAVAANTVHDRFDDGKSNGRGQGRIHCIAAGQQHAQAGLRCQWLGCADNIRGQHGHAAAKVREFPEGVGRHVHTP